MVGSDWFEANFYEIKGETVYHLRHDLGENEYIYQSLYGMFDSLLDTEVRTGIKEDSVTIYIPNQRNR